MKRLNIILAIINILLVAAMILHIGISIYIHSQQQDWGAPLYAEFIKAIYYVVPLIAVNIAGLIIRIIIRKKKS